MVTLIWGEGRWEGEGRRGGREEQGRERGEGEGEGRRGRREEKGREREKEGERSTGVRAMFSETIILFMGQSGHSLQATGR